jgi:hypothetical protein
MAFWKRFTRLQIGNTVITNNELDIYFTVKGSTDGIADEAEISIYNLSQATKEQITTPDTPLKLEAGYEGDYGIIFLGTVQENRDETDGADTKTIITALSYMTKLMTATVNKAYPRGSKLTDVAKDLITLAGITLLQVDDNPKIFEKQKTYSGATTSYQNILEIAKNLNYDFFERRGAVMLVKPESGVIEGFVLNSDTGLLKVNKEGNKDKHIFNIRSLLIYQIAQGSIIDLDTALYGKKLCRVESVVFSSTEQEQICTMEAEIL